MQGSAASLKGFDFAHAGAALLAHRATQRAATLAALLLLCWALAQATWKLWQPAAPAVERANVETGVDIRSVLAARPFGNAAVQPAGDAGNLARSNLNITLTGVAARRAGGCALVVVQGQPESAYCAGEELTPGVRLESVQADRIVILRNGVRESVAMKDVDGASAIATSPQISLQPIVRSLGDRQVVDRRALQQQLGRPEFLSQALIVPSPGGGFLVREIQSGSLYEKLGLRPGDVIRNVNGQALSNMDELMRMYQQFGTAERITVDVQRQGRSETLYYDMR